jgi:anaerobic selenocysteine-containing dehydrogenase
MSADTESKGVKRRDFLKVLGASTAATAIVGCSQEHVEKLIPYLVSPDHTVPGVSTYYATTCRECAAGCGVIAETRDGRTIKLEGNVEHPVNQGALCARGQAALQGLYNPDRYRSPMVRNGGKLEATTWDNALKIFAQKLGEAQSKSAAGIAFVNRHETGSFPGFLDQWLSAYGAPAHISYDAEVDLAAMSAHRAVYGVNWPRFDFAASRLIISFGADFLDGWGLSIAHQLSYADARGKLAEAPRSIYIGPRRTLTGLNADEWIDCKPGSELQIAKMLSGAVTPEQAAQASGVAAGRLQALLDEFRAAKPSLLLAGGTGPDAVEVANTVAALNQTAGNVGVTIKPTEPLTGFDRIGSSADVRALGERMNAGAVSLLLVRHVNPASTLGKASGFAAAMAKVPFKISFSSVPDDTTEACDLILPDHHSLEQWGDAEPVRGLLSLQQPTMDSVFDTRATSDVLIDIAKTSPALASRYPGGNYRSWLISRFPGGAAGLNAALPKGIVGGSAFVSQVVRAPAVAKPAVVALDQTKGDLYLMVYTHPLLGDGRGANKPWLQELPDPVNKTVWQTVAEVHPATAQRLGVGNGDLVKIETAAGALSLPVYIYLGIRQDTVAVATGRGHVAAGRYAKAGHNALDLLSVAENSAGGMSFLSTKATVTKAGTHVALITTEGSARQHGRGIARAMLPSELSGGIEVRGEGARGHGTSGKETGDTAAVKRRRRRGSRPWPRRFGRA